MKEAMLLNDFKVLQGKCRAEKIYPDETGTIRLSAALPQGWENYTYGVTSLKVEATDKPVVHFGLAKSEREEPLLSMDYRFLQKCKIWIPFPVGRESLKAEHWFLPPWPGVFKGNYRGRSIRPEEVCFLIVTLLANELSWSEVPSVLFTDQWQPSEVTGEPLVDEFGQRKDGIWPGKTNSFEEMEAALKKEYELAKQGGDYPEGWSRWGGWQGKRFEATGWFRCEKEDGRWWLVDPDGCAFFSNGMCYGNRTGIYAMEDHLDALYESLPPKEGLYRACWTTGDQIPQYVVRNGLENAKKRVMVNFSRANMMRVFGEKWLDAWIILNVSRMKYAGINTLGIGVNDYGDEYTTEFLKKARMPYVITLKYFPLTNERIFRDFPDVFSPEYEKLARQIAQTVLVPYQNDPYLIGYFVTNEPEWQAYDQVNLGLKLLEAKGCTASKKALVSFLQQKYHQIEKLNEAWGLHLNSFEYLLTESHTGRHTQLMARDCMEFHRILVEKYGDVINECFRQADPHHLNLGMRYASFTEKKAGPAFCDGIRQFDIFSFNRYGAEPVTPAKILGKNVDMPAIVGEWHIGSTEGGLDIGGLFYTKTQVERAEAIQYYLEQSTQEPHLVGIHYFEYSDQPYLGRFDGECYQIGLIDVCNRPYPEVLSAFHTFADRMYPLLLGERVPMARTVEIHPMKQ